MTQPTFNLHRYFNFPWFISLRFCSFLSNTQGTTGNPKGATLTHHNIVNNGYLMGFRTNYHEEIHRLCLPVPLYHCLGCVMGVLSAASHGGASILPSPVFSAREAIKAVAQQR
jgi:acyl-CoA synthetase (AMP-forming)/AMP-acid ligase II